MSDRNHIIGLARGLIGAAIGGIVGYFAFRWIYQQGFYAMVLPGAALGFGFSLLTDQRSTLNGVICAVLAIGLGIFTEWRFFRFVGEETFLDFLAQFHTRTPVTFVMIGLGGLLAYWSVNRRDRGKRHESTANPSPD